MSNAQDVRTKESIINIDGNEYVVKFTMNSFIELEDAFGSIEGALEAIRGKVVLDDEGNEVKIKVKDPVTGEETEEPKRNMSLKALRKFLWVGLMSKHPEMTEKDVGNIISLTNMTEIINAITSTLTASLPQVEEVTSEDKNKDQSTDETPKN